MAFVNEYVPEEDVKKYGLTEMWLRYHPEYDSYPASFRHKWTVDRERDAYFMVVVGGGREGEGPLCLLHFAAGRFSVQLRKARSSSIAFDEQPYRIVWDLMDIRDVKGQ